MKLINWIKKFFTRKTEQVVNKELTTEMLYAQIGNLDEYISSNIAPLFPKQSWINIYFTIKGNGNGLRKLRISFPDFKHEKVDTPVEVIDSIFDAFGAYYKNSELQSYDASMYVKLEVFNEDADDSTLDYSKEWHPTQYTDSNLNTSK